MRTDLILLALLAFAAPVLILVAIWLRIDKAPVTEVEHANFSFISEHYTNLAGVPVSIESAGREGFDCIIDFQDGTLGLGLGISPFEAYTNAMEGERYLGTTGA